MNLCEGLTVLLIALYRIILATSLRYTSRIHKHWCSLFYINSWQNKLIHIVYNLLRVMMDYKFIIVMDLRLLCTTGMQLLSLE